MLQPSVPMPDTLLGVDELIRSELEGFAAHWFWALLGFTLLVAVGLAFEFPEIWHDTIRSIKEIYRCPAIKRKLSPWAKLTGTLGWILIIAGVVGEGIAEGFLFKADGLVIKFDEILLNDTTKSAGRANLSAKSAADASSRARTDARLAQETANAANRKSDQATGKAEAVETKAAKLDDELAGSEYWAVISRIHLKRYFDTQLKRETGREVPEPLMTSVLNKYPTANAIIVCRYDTKGETYQTARGISHALWAAHWKVNSLKPPCVGPNGEHPLEPNLPSLPKMTGGELFIIANAKTLKGELFDNSAATGLVNALITMDGGIQNVTDERLPDGTFTILVGPKLPTPF